MLPKPKTPFKIHFLIRTKTSSSIFIFSWGGDVFICHNLDFRGVILIFTKQRHWFGRQNQKKPLKRWFWTKQKHHTKEYSNFQKVMFLDFLFLTFKGCFWFWQHLVYFAPDWLFQPCNFFRTYLATFSPKKTEKYESS